MNFHDFNEIYGPRQNLYGGTPGLQNLMHMPGTPAMQEVQLAPPGYIWTLLRIGDQLVLVNGFVINDQRIGHMIGNTPYGPGDTLQVEIPDDLGLLPE